MRIPHHSEIFLLVFSALLLAGCGVQVRLLNSRHAATLSNDSRIAASAVYGQSDYTSNPAAEFGLRTPRSPQIIGGKFFLADQGAHRVLIWNTPPANAAAKPDVVLGQINLQNSASNGTVDSILKNGAINFPRAWGFNTPTGICSDGTKLVIADNGNHRVLIWNTIPTVNATPADVVLGQPDFVSKISNHGGRSAKSLVNPYGVTCAGGKLYVSDYGNHRILFWNSIPSTSFASADGVIGQPDFVSGAVNNGGVSASTLNGPLVTLVLSGKFLIADYLNNRVLVWNTATPASSSAADSVIGQPNFTTITASGASGHVLYRPASLAAIGTSLYVMDYSNHRILVWNSIPASGAIDADFVIGQPNFTTTTANTGGIGASTVNAPIDAATDGTKLYVADAANNRLLIFNSLPSANAPVADAVWGQVAMNLGAAGDGAPANGRVAYPFYTAYNGGYYWAADSRHARVLRWPSGKTPFDGFASDRVLGQTDLTDTTRRITAGGLGNPTSIASDGTKVYVTDNGNHRVLIWNSMPLSDGAPADAVIGQPDFVSSTANNGGVSNHSLNSPYHLSIDSGKLFVADYNSNRVLIWNTLPSTTNAPADVVLGQPGFGSAVANNGGVSAASLSLPSCAHVFSGKLFVCDRNNSRILVWNTVPTVNNTPADFVIGQPDMTSVAVDRGQPEVNALGLNQPLALAYNGGRFFISDSGNNRILIWNGIPLAGEAPIQVLGQSDFKSGTINSGGLSSRSLFVPLGLVLHGSDLLVSDYGNYRLLRFTGLDP